MKMEEERNMAGKGRLVSHRHSLVSLLEASEPYPHCGAQVKSLVSSLISIRKKKKKGLSVFSFVNESIDVVVVVVVVVFPSS